MQETDRPSRRCSDGGYVVGALRHLGEPWQRQLGSLGSVIGCSRLVCRVCTQRVVSQPRVALAPGVLPRAGHAGDALVQSALVAGTPSSRLYCCACFSWIEIEATACRPPADFDVFSPDMPWSCDGHPTLARRDERHPEIDRLAEATTLLTVERSAGAPAVSSGDALKLMWAAAEDSLRGELDALIRGQLRDGAGVGLARALAVTEADPGAFRDELAAFDAHDRRLADDDRTRTGWLLRDRLAAALGAYVLTTQDWPSVERTASALLPGTASRALVRACLAADPDRVVDALVARTASSRPHSSTLDHWARTLEGLIASDDAAGDGAGARLERLIASAREQAAARVAVDRALDILLSRWQFGRPEAETRRILQLIEAYHPPRGFHRTIELLEDLFDHAAAPAVESEALRALDGYYRTAPLHAEPGFEAYVRLLARCGDMPHLAERAWQSLLALDRLDLSSAAAEIVADASRMKILIRLCLEARDRARVEGPLSQLFHRCLTDDRGDGALKKRFRDSVAAHGWRLHDDHDPPVLHHATHGRLALEADPRVRQVDWTAEFQHGASGDVLLSEEI